MRKLAFTFVAALALAAPTVASAEGFSVRIGDDGYYGPRYYRDYDRGYRHHDHGWHRGWYKRHDGERVIIRRHRHDWDDED